MLDLQDDVVCKPSVELVEVVVRGASAIVLQIAPVHVVVVDEAAVEDDAAVRGERTRNDVGGIGMRAAVGARAQASLGIGFDHEPAQIRDALVEIVDRLLPPADDPRVEWIESVETANLLRTAEINRQHQMDAPRPERFCQADQLRTVRGREQSCIGVDVVDGAAVQAERRQQPRVIARPRQVRPDVPIIEKDGVSAVPALDRAIEVVPLIDPADGRGRLLAEIDVVERAMQADQTKQCEYAVQHGAIGAPGDDEPLSLRRVRSPCSAEFVARTWM